MPRAIWTGSISFGLVNAPVKLYSATESKDIHFNQFEAGTDRRIHYKRVAEGTGKEVDYDDIVKGYEVSDGHFVIVTPEELESVEPGRTKTIDIEDFVSLEEIDPIYFEKSYYLAPGERGDKAYALLRESMRRAGRIAIGRFVMRTKQYLAAVRPSGNVLVLETMFFGDEVRDSGDLYVPSDVRLSDRELRIADQLIESLTVPFEPRRYTDTYRERVLQLIEEKAEGKEVVVQPAAEERAAPADLLAALEASIAEARGRRPAKGKGDDKASGDDGQLDEMSKEELYDRAADADIAGRSKMTKGQLVDALRQAS